MTKQAALATLGGFPLKNSVIASRQTSVSNLLLTLVSLRDCVSNRGNPIKPHKRGNPLKFKNFNFSQKQFLTTPQNIENKRKIKHIDAMQHKNLQKIRKNACKFAKMAYNLQ